MNENTTTSTTTPDAVAEQVKALPRVRVLPSGLLHLPADHPDYPGSDRQDSTGREYGYVAPADPANPYLLLHALDEESGTGFWLVEVDRPAITEAPGAVVGARAWWMPKEHTEHVAPEGVRPGIPDFEWPASADQQAAELETAQGEVLRLTGVNEEQARQLAMLRADLQAAQERVLVVEDEHQHDIDAIAERLHNEAENRDWCEVYDEVVAEVNRNLNRPLPLREREVEVEVTGWLRVPFTHTVTLTMPGGYDEDEARRMIEESDLLDTTTELFENSGLYSAEVEGDWEVAEE